jgi:hypothetical protein
MADYGSIYYRTVIQNITDFVFCRQHALNKTLEQLKKEIQVCAKETIAFFIAQALP